MVAFSNTGHWLNSLSISSTLWPSMEYSVWFFSFIVLLKISSSTVYVLPEARIYYSDSTTSFFPFVHRASEKKSTARITRENGCYAESPAGQAEMQQGFVFRLLHFCRFSWWNYWRIRLSNLEGMWESVNDVIIEIEQHDGYSAEDDTTTRRRYVCWIRLRNAKMNRPWTNPTADWIRRF